MEKNPIIFYNQEMQNKKAIFLVFLGSIGLILVFLAIGLSNSSNNNEDLLEVGPIIDDVADTASRPNDDGPAETKEIDLKEINQEFDFKADVNSDWNATYNESDQAISIFKSKDSGLNQAQIYIKFFKANQFLTLKTVDILERTELTIVGRPAVRYRIIKKEAVADFPNQPDWRSDEHEVTDIRSTDDNPAVFYVFARNPELSVEIFDNFLSSLNFGPDTVSDLVEPTEEFLGRITLKPFGILIDPVTSPVQPERFSGYHTAVDVEFGDRPNEDIPIVAIADGQVVLSRTASGYGGVVVIKHQINDSQVFAIYGHLDPVSLVANGQEISAGERVGILGKGGTSETDGERKHLHFGLYKGSEPNIAGYVSSRSELDSWIDPLSLFK